MSYGYYQPYWNSDEELEHFGIKGMKWGIRRYQNPDGTLTEAGKKRYGSAENFEISRERSKARQQAIRDTTKKVTKFAAKATVKAAMLGAVGVGAVSVANLLGSRDGQQLINYGSRAISGYFTNQATKNNLKVLLGSYDNKADEFITKWMVQTRNKNLENRKNKYTANALHDMMRYLNDENITRSWVLPR